MKRIILVLTVITMLISGCKLNDANQQATVATTSPEVTAATIHISAEEMGSVEEMDAMEQEASFPSPYINENRTMEETILHFIV